MRSAFPTFPPRSHCVPGTTIPIPHPRSRELVERERGTRMKGASERACAFPTWDPSKNPAIRGTAIAVIDSDIGPPSTRPTNRQRLARRSQSRLWPLQGRPATLDRPRSPRALYEPVTTVTTPSRRAWCFGCLPTRRRSCRCSLTTHGTSSPCCAVFRLLHLPGSQFCERLRRRRAARPFFRCASPRVGNQPRPRAARRLIVDDTFSANMSRDDFDRAIRSIAGTASPADLGSKPRREVAIKPLRHIGDEPDTEIADEPADEPAHAEPIDSAITAAAKQLGINAEDLASHAATVADRPRPRSRRSAGGH